MSSKQEAIKFCTNFVINKINENKIYSNMTGEFNSKESLLVSGMLDSFDLVELITAFENEFDLTLDLENIDVRELSVETMINLIEDQIIL